MTTNKTDVKTWSLVSHAFGYPLYIHENGEEFTDNAGEAMELSEMDNKELKEKWFSSKTGLYFKAEVKA